MGVEMKMEKKSLKKQRNKKQATSVHNPHENQKMIQKSYVYRSMDGAEWLLMWYNLSNQITKKKMKAWRKNEKKSKKRKNEKKLTQT